MKKILFLAGFLVALMIGGVLLYLFPPLGELIFGLLGESEYSIFGRAAEIVKQYLTLRHSSPNAMLEGFWLLLSTEIISAILMGCCIFILKSIFTKFNRNYIGGLLYPKWLITFLGVCLGLGANSLIGAVTPDAVGELLKSLLSLGLLLLGIGMMLGFKGRTIDPNKKSHRRFRRAHLGYIVSLVLDIVGNAFNAILAVSFITSYLTGPALLHDDAYFGRLIELCVVCLVFMWLFDIITILIKDFAES
ncbi:MAG: hypothetical protein IKK75_06935 [Clostridia bacterium]|nr:hypothetical protein [Clostridia bacterium]